MTFIDYIAIRPELLEDGQPTGFPDPIPGVAATFGGTRTVDGVTEFLCRVRGVDGQLPEGLDLLTEAEFKAAHPDLWTAFGMDVYEVETEDGVSTVTPSIPVFL